MADLQACTTWVRRRYLRHRRLIAAGLAAAATVVAVNVLAPQTPATSPVVVVSRDLGAGAVLGASDVRLVSTVLEEPVDHSYTSLAAVIGETLAAPVRAGEPLTDQRLVGTALLQGYPPDLVATPVRVHDADVLSLLHVGDRLDVYAADGDATTTAALVASDVQVVTLPTPSDEGRDGGLLVLAVTSGDAARLAQVQATTDLSVSLRG